MSENISYIVIIYIIFLTEYQRSFTNILLRFLYKLKPIIHMKLFTESI